jgi:hypothetical protein
MTVLNFGTSATVPQEFAVLLVTLEEAHRSPGSFTRVVAKKTDSSVSAYRYLSEDSEHSFWFAESGKSWRQGAVSSDAGFVCWSQKPANRLILYNGSYAAIEGGPELCFQHAVSWGEVTLEGAIRTVVSSDPEAEQKEVVASDTASRHP